MTSLVRTTLLLILALAVLAPSPADAQVPPATLPLVWVLATGGTISGKGATSTSLADYKSGALRGEDLVAAVPEIAQVARVQVEQVANISSTDITTAHWLTLARRINAIFDADPAVAGVVVTHGTNTLEETAYFLNLTVKHDRPVVVVGSMRPASAISADGPLNLLNAVRTAASMDAVGKGTLVVLNDEINAARDATKTNTYRVETFRSGELGVLGYVDADKVALYRAPIRRHTTRSEFDVRALATLPAVDILYSYVEPSTTLAAALVAGGVQGIVVAGTGAGGMSAREREAFTPLLSGPEASRPIVVRSNRTGNGRVLPQAESDVLGMVPGDNLSPQKARVLLMLALTKTRDLAEIRRMFAEYLNRGRDVIQAHHYVLAVPDLERSAAFYRDVLGFTVHEMGDPGWRLFVKNECRIMAGACPDALPARALGDHSYFGYLLVDDADAYHARAVAAGGEVTKSLRDEPWGMREFGLRTVDGHRLMIGSRLDAA